MRIRSYKKYRENLKRHFNRRMDEHYGIYINDCDRKDILNSISSGQARLIKKVSNTRSFYLVEFQERELLVLYSKKHKALVTAYPEEAIGKLKREAVMEARLKAKLQESAVNGEAKALRIVDYAKMLFRAEIDGVEHYFVYDEISGSLSLAWS